MQKIQNRAARIVTNSPFDASAAPLIQNLGWPTFSDLTRKETATLVYKSLNSLAPAYMTKLFTKYSDDRERTLLSTETDLRLPLLKKGFSILRSKTLERFTKRSKIGTLPENFQGTNIEDGVILTYISFLLYFIVN